MADNITLDVGAGGDTVAADDIGGVKYARNKITLGADGVNDGDVSSSNPMPIHGTGSAGTADSGVVTVQGIASMTPVQVGDNSSSLTVDAPVASPVFVRLSDGAAAISTLPVQLNSINASLFAKYHDAAASAGEIGVAVVGVRKDTPANMAGTDGDWEYLQLSGGRVWTYTTLDGALPAGTNAIGKLAANNGVDIGDVTINNSTGGSAVNIQDGGNSITVDGTVTATISATVTEDASSVGGESLLLVGGIRNDSATSQTSTNSDYGAFSVDSAGRVGITDLGGSITVDNAGTFAVQATLQAGSASIGILGANSGVDIGDVTINNSTGGSAVNIQDGGNSLTVDSPVATPLFVRLSDGADPVDTIPVSISGMSTSLYAHQEDAASANAHLGVGCLAVRKDTPANTSGTDGDYEFIQMSAGRVWTSAVLEAGSAAIGKLAANDGVDIGDVTINNSTIAVTQSGTWNVGTVTTVSTITNVVHVDDNSGSLTVDAPVGTPVYVRLSDGASAITTLPVSLASVPSHAVTLASQVTEDVASAGGETLVLIGGTRNDSAVSQTSTNGDYGTFAIDSAGRMGVADLGGSISVDDNSSSLTVDAPVGTPVYVRLSDGAAAISTLPVSLAAGAAAIAKAEDVASADADVGVPAMAVRKATPANTSGTDGDYEMLQMSAGRLWTSTAVDTALPAGTNSIGNVGLIPRTSGGLTLYNNIDLDETKVQVKGSAGQVYWIHAMNMSNIPLYLKFWNLLAASVTVGTTAATMVVPLPTQGNTNGARTQISIPQGLAFDTGITIACVTGVGTAASAGPAANELVISMGYA